MKTFAASVLSALLVSCLAAAYIPRWPVVPLVESGAIKSWSTRETLTSADLNANFNHIHTLMVGGHGGRLVDADVNTSAGIASSKLAGYRYLPVAWVSIVNGVTACTASPCTMNSSQGVTSVTRASAGLYTVTMSNARANTAYAVLVGDTMFTANVKCYHDAAVKTTTQFNVYCYQIATSVATDSTFTAIVMDND